MLPDNFSNFKFAIFEFKTKILSECTLPSYKGSTLRGGFGHSFRRVACCMPKNCECKDCIVKNKCIYSYVFETPPPDGTAMMSKYPAVPHPFIIEPPLEVKRYYTGDEIFNFNLILTGKSIDYLPYFIYAFEETGKNGLGRERQGKYTVESVVNHNLFLTNGSIIYEREKKSLESPSHIITAEDIKKIIVKWENINSVRLNFLTPTRVKYEEKLVDYLEFHMFMRNFLRRLSSLCYFHCGFELELDYKEIIEKSKSVRRINSNFQWFDWERYSSRQKTKIPLGGFTGEVVYTGDLREFAIFILLGKYLHIGSAASFGMGKYEVKF